MFLKKKLKYLQKKIKTFLEIPKNVSPANRKSAVKNRILLHTCCAPCLIYPLERLKKQNLQAAGFFYNPNIYPLDEYKKRRRAVVHFSVADDLEIFYPEYIPSDFSYAVHENKDKPARCTVCWTMRLRKTAQFAKRNGFLGFSTTLLVSPYQDHGVLKKIGENVGREEGVPFYYEDFRAGFREAHHQAKSQGMYCQNYCGCMYSYMERCRKSGKL
ncbi:MAG: epoxyqueuosine reductase QueH [Candidatus Omnitrophota bacterium]|jgi:hypothetical protein